MANGRTYVSRPARFRIRARHTGLSAWVFLLPALLFFVGYQVYPIFRVIWISFTNYEFLSSEPAEVGRLRQLHRGAQRSR